MPNRSFSFISFAGVMILAIACSGDNPAGPASSQVNSSNAPLNSAIKSDIAAAAGNAIATDLETLVVNQAASVGSFSVLLNIPSASFSESSGTDTAATSQPNCAASSEPGVFVCLREPGPGDHLKCTYSEERKVFLCVKQEEQQNSTQTTTTDSCTFNAADLVYSCVKVAKGKSVVKSYQFLDASGKPMEKFVSGTTESIRYRLQTDGSEANDGGTSVTHSLRYITVSGFLGPNRIWNGFGASADTNSHKENLSTRKYTGLSVDTLKAVTFVDQRNLHPYPLSGVAIRVVDYTVVSSGTQTETTTVHKRVVVTFNGMADVPISLGDYSCVLHLDTHKVDGCK